MSADTFTNFASTTLASPSPLTSGGTSFSVATSSGALFPTANFLLTIDSEIVLITSRSGDSFVIGTRGYDGTTASSHSVGATIQLSICAYNLRHIWQNIADSFEPRVPPIQVAKTPSTWDNEFESLGSWTLYPASPSGSSIWNAGTTMRSHLLCNPASGDQGTYYAYIAFNPLAGAWMATAKLSNSLSLDRTLNNDDQMNFAFSVSDQTNPTSGLGNGVSAQHTLVAAVQPAYNTSYAGGITSAGITQNISCYVKSVLNGTGGGSFGATLACSHTAPLFLRIYTNGSGYYAVMVGDGTTFWTLGSKSSLSFTPQTLVLSMNNPYRPSGLWMSSTWAIDFVRVITGSSLNPTFGP